MVTCVYFPTSVALGVIGNEIHNVTISEGKRATFTCMFNTTDNSDVIIFWTVADQIFDDCKTSQQGVAPGNNGCYENKAESVLVVEDVTIFGAGEILVRCNLDQNLDENFLNDSSFQTGYNDIITTEAFLKIGM